MHFRVLRPACKVNVKFAASARRIFSSGAALEQEANVLCPELESVFARRARAISRLPARHRREMFNCSQLESKTDLR